MKCRSRKTIATLSIVLLILPSACMFQGMFGGPFGGLFSGSFTILVDAAEEEFTVSAPFTDAGSLSIRWVNGNVTVSVDESATDIIATGTKFVLASGDTSAADRLDDLGIEFQVAESFPTQVFLRYTVLDASDASFHANVDVVIPSGITLHVTNENGTVSVTGNTESTSVTVTNGRITVADQTGNVTADTTNGTVEIDSAGDVQATSINGSIDITARPGSADSIIARTTNGQVAILVPAETAANLTLGVALGFVEFTLTDFTVTDLVAGLNQVSATLNGGGLPITAETSTGVVSFGSLQDDS